MTTTTTARGDRHHLEQCGICHAAPGTACEGVGAHRGRRWQLALTAPRPTTVEQFGAYLLTPDGGPCRPTVEDTYWWDHSRRDGRFTHESVRVAIIYRGACCGCGWAGPTRVDENDAVEDAHDHAWPGWRALPVVPRQPHDAKPKDLARWRDTCRKLYRLAGLDADHWTQQHAPFRTVRQPRCTRSHCTWNGGYDISAGTSEPAPTTATPCAQQQLSLW